MKRVRYLLACALVTAGIGGTGALALAAADGPADEVFEVSLLDGAIEVEGDAPEAGASVVEALNGGSEEHELVILRTERAPDELALGLHGISVEHSGELVFGEDHLAEGHAHDPGEVTGLLPGESLRYSVELAPGHYVAFCQTGGHYLAGEAAEFTVR